MKNILQTLKKILIGVLGFFLIYLLAVFILSIIPVNKNVENKEEISIYILSNGVHTDIVVPIKTDVIDWSNYIKYEDTVGKDSTAKYLGLGWGDKGFYLDTPTWGDLKFSTAFNAAFGLSTSAMHTTFYKVLQEGEDCKKNSISKENYQKLITYIFNSFLKDNNKNFIHIKTNANYGTNDSFYEGTGSYNLFYTCNNWANNALKAANQKAALWTPADKGIFYHYKN